MKIARPKLLNTFTVGKIKNQLSINPYLFSSIYHVIKFKRITLLGFFIFIIISSLINGTLLAQKSIQNNNTDTWTYLHTIQAEFTNLENIVLGSVLESFNSYNDSIISCETNTYPSIQSSLSVWTQLPIDNITYKITPSVEAYQLTRYLFLPNSNAILLNPNRLTTNLKPIYSIHTKISKKRKKKYWFLWTKIHNHLKQPTYKIELKYNYLETLSILLKLSKYT